MSVAIASLAVGLCCLAIATGWRIWWLERLVDAQGSSLDIHAEVILEIIEETGRLGDEPARLELIRRIREGRRG